MPLSNALVSQVRDALAHLYDPAYLQTHPLARVPGPAAASRSTTPGKALRQSLLDAVEALRPPPEAPPDSHAWRGYHILRLRHVEGLDLREIEQKLAVSQSEYYRIYRRALEAVASLLRQRWGPADSPDVAPPPRVVPVGALPELASSRLPTALTSFVGRERELAEVKRLLGTTRLLTLTGTGGCGKTRLAYQVATDIRDGYPDGVWVVELAALSEPDLVAQTVALALDVREDASRPILATLADRLGSKRLLLVLDNCEHLLDPCASLAETILQSCPDLTILATSRQPLGILGEVSWRVPSLETPSPERLAPLPELGRFEAVRLFVERATASSPSFRLSERNASAVAGICSRLDGIPLALELAAAQVRVISVEQIAQRLGGSFAMLTGGSRTALPRQQTLQATIDWSHNRLTAAERVLFRRLATFVGGFSLEAAEAVCSGDGLEEQRVLGLLAHLADQSLVLVEGTETGNARYRLLETLRQYGWERLAEAGEADLAHLERAILVLLVADFSPPRFLVTCSRGGLASGRTRPSRRVVEIRCPSLLGWPVSRWLAWPLATRRYSFPGMAGGN